MTELVLGGPGGVWGSVTELVLGGPGAAGLGWAECLFGRLV